MVTCAVNIQGVLGEGTLGYKVMLMIYMVKMDVLMCFRADILLEIPRVHISK